MSPSIPLGCTRALLFETIAGDTSGSSVLANMLGASKDMLKTRIEQFIAYFNATMAKPFRWTYAGKPLAG